MKTNWMTSALEDLQMLALEHQMQSIAFALDDVIEIAEKEVIVEPAVDYLVPKSSQEVTESSIVQFPTLQ